MKELCEGKESCKITPSQILAGHSKCQKVQIMRISGSIAAFKKTKQCFWQKSNFVNDNDDDSGGGEKAEVEVPVQRGE